MKISKFLKEFFTSSDIPLPIEEEIPEKPVSKLLKLFLWILFITLLGGLFIWLVLDFWHIISVIDDFVKSVGETLGFNN